MPPGSFLLQLVNRETRIAHIVFIGHLLNLWEVRELCSMSFPAPPPPKKGFFKRNLSPGCDMLSVTFLDTSFLRDFCGHGVKNEQIQEHLALIQSSDIP